MTDKSLRERLDVVLAHSAHLGSAEQADDAIKCLLTFLSDNGLAIVPTDETKMDGVVAIKMLLAGKDALFSLAEDPQIEDARNCFVAMLKAAPPAADLLRGKNDEQG